MINLDDEIKQAEIGLEQKKTEYLVQHGIVLALKYLKEKEDASRNGREVSNNESGESANN